jgi:hypothetical protein
MRDYKGGLWTGVVWAIWAVMQLMKREQGEKDNFKHRVGRREDPLFLGAREGGF